MKKVITVEGRAVTMEVEPELLAELNPPTECNCGGKVEVLTVNCQDDNHYWGYRVVCPQCGEYFC